jgi:hypothetical protein
VIWVRHPNSLGRKTAQIRGIFDALAPDWLFLAGYVGGESVSQPPMKDKAFLSFSDQNLQVELPPNWRSVHS